MSRATSFNLSRALDFLEGLDVNCKNCGRRVATSLSRKDVPDGTCSVTVMVNEKRGFHYGIYCSDDCAMQMLKKARETPSEDLPLDKEADRCPACRKVCITGPGSDPTMEMIITDIPIEKIKFRFICCSLACAEAVGRWPAWSAAAEPREGGRGRGRRPPSSGRGGRGGGGGRAAAAAAPSTAGGWSRVGRGRGRAAAADDDRVFCDMCGDPSDSTTRCTLCRGKYCEKCMSVHVEKSHGGGQ
ncbi:MAG: hypothetical protein WC483_00600 [Candidatus Paceibacterota bacterium]